MLFTGRERELGTPSEVFVAHILKNIGFDNVKYVDEAFDFTAHKNGKQCVIEAKTMPRSQLQGLADAALKGKKVFLIVTDAEHYSLFNMLSTDLVQKRRRKHLPRKTKTEEEKDKDWRRFLRLLKKK